jgi:hypothetical protein
MTHTDPSTRSPDTQPEGDLAEALVGAGAAWARYGLTVARASLGATARTLEATAGLLGALSERFAERAEDVRPESDQPR